MFIAHGDFLRRHARWILAGVLVLLIPGFVALFTTTGSGGRKLDAADLPSIHGKPIEPGEFQRARNAVRISYLLSTGRDLPRSASADDQITREAVLRIVMLQKAAEFGIHVGADEVVEQLRRFPSFVNENGQFDPERYRRMMVYLNNYGVGEGDFEAVMRGQIVIQQLQTLVASAAKVTPQQIALTYGPLHERVGIDLVAFDVANTPAPATVTDADAQAYFEKSAEAFRVPVQVKVRYAHFTMTGAKPGLQLTDNEIANFYERNKMKYTDTNGVAMALDTVRGEIREELLTMRASRRAGDRATEFSVKLVQTEGGAAPEFATLAGEFGVTAQETDFFAARDTVAGVEAGPVFNQAAFALTTDAPCSDPIEGKDGYYVLQLLERKPSRIPEFVEVKTKVVERLQRERTHEATTQRGRDAAVKIKEAVAKGKSFADACAELGLKPTTPAPFTLSDETKTLPAASQIKQMALGMPVGAVSDFVPTTTGGVFFHLRERSAPDPAAFEKDKEQFTARALQQQRQAIFESWLESVVRAEQVSFGRMRSRSPMPEAGTEEESAPEAAPAPAQS